VCSLLVQVLDRSLYLELCVSYMCGVRPVLGRVEDFSREIKPMMHGMQQYETSYFVQLGFRLSAGIC
jgi:nuclear pore complex protein Nup188